IGRRSGNRGECAQPCRLEYNGSKALLSIPDMCLASHIPEICDMGVASLKIEGRMKSPEYVFGVTSVYRRLIDEHRSATVQEIKALKDSVSRGFTDAFYMGGRMRSGAVRSEADKAASAREESRLRAQTSRIISDLKSLEVPERDSILPEFTPIRAAKTARGMKKIKKTSDFGLRIVFSPGAKYSENLLSRIRSLDYGDKHLEGIYFPLSERLPAHHGLYGVVTPAVVMDSDRAKFDRLLQNGTNKGYKKCLVKNVSHIFCVENADYSLQGAMELNIYNSESVKAWRERGFESVVLSSECLTAQIRDIDKYKIPCGAVIYGRLALMSTRTCIISHDSPCTECREGCSRRAVLRDRTGAKFPVYADGFGYNIIYNSLPLCAADRIKSLCDFGVAFGVLYFTDESEEQIIKIIKSFIKNENPNVEYTRGYLK
ncbi:MAG: U32 family peptidase, partial [Clostridia bacterium]|nr:U32 family peptidase [Clostridia bacterium]